MPFVIVRSKHYKDNDTMIHNAFNQTRIYGSHLGCFIVVRGESIFYYIDTGAIISYLWLLE